MSISLELTTREGETIEVDAVAHSPYLAIHNNIGAPQGYLAVTHIPTGFRISARAIDVMDAVAVADEIRDGCADLGIDLATTDPEYLATAMIEHQAHFPLLRRSTFSGHLKLNRVDMPKGAK